MVGCRLKPTTYIAFSKGSESPIMWNCASVSVRSSSSESPVIRITGASISRATALPRTLSCVSLPSTHSETGSSSRMPIQPAIGGVTTSAQ